MTMRKNSSTRKGSVADKILWILRVVISRHSQKMTKYGVFFEFMDCFGLTKSSLAMTAWGRAFELNFTFCYAKPPNPIRKGGGGGLRTLCVCGLPRFCFANSRNDSLLHAFAYLENEMQNKMQNEMRIF